MPIFGPKCQFWAKFGRFWAQNPIFWGQGVKILVPSYRDSNETPFSCWKHWSVGLKLAAKGKNVLFWPQNLDIWGQKSIFCIVIAIFVDGTNDHYTRGYNFPIGTTPKKISVSELGVIFWETGVFTFGRKVVFGLKMGLTPKNHPKWHFPLDYLGKGTFFLWTTFSGRGQNMVNLKSEFFFGP